MHIKQAIQRRKNQKYKQLSCSSSFLKRSNIIGSIHTGRLNYHHEQPFFSDFRLRDKVKEAKQYVSTLKDGDILELRQKPWNGSVIVPRKFSDFQKEESQRSKLLKIKLGLSDFKEIKCDRNKIYQGTQTRDKYTGWNVSTHFQKKQKKQGEQLSTINAIENSLKYNHSNLSNYKSLNKRYNEALSDQKQYWQKSSDILTNLKLQFLFNHPNSSPQKTNAAVFKMFDCVKKQNRKKSLMQSQDTEDSLNNFKAKLSPIQKQKIKQVYFHTGCWEKCNQKTSRSDDSDTEIMIANAENQYKSRRRQKNHCWSCCMNGEKQSRGCSYRIQDGNRMNLSSFNV